MTAKTEGDPDNGSDDCTIQVGCTGMRGLHVSATAFPFAQRNAAAGAAALDRAVSAARNPSAGIGRANSQPCP